MQASNMNEIQTSILSKLKEMADEYKLTFSHSKDCQFAFFTKVEVGMGDPCFTLCFDWNNNTVRIFHLDKTVELKDVEWVARLLCEVIA